MKGLQAMSQNIRNTHKKHSIDFIDREIYTNQIESSYKDFLHNYVGLKILFFYGAGGFGKTALLNRAVSIMHNSKPLYITLEITDRDDKLDILIKFRKKLPVRYSYPLFDYAIQLLWNNLNTAQLDTDFYDFTQKNLVQFIKACTDVAVTALSPVGIAAASGMDILEQVYKTLKTIYGKHKISSILENIKIMQPHELIDKLPELLGLDIHKAFLETPLIFIIDSYQQYSKRLIEPSGWLISLISYIEYGYFIITSREKIHWPDNLKKYVKSYELGILPEDDVRSTFKSEFFLSDELIDNIITVTGCIPIYLDLAVRALDNNDKNCFPCDQIYFKSKEDIVNKFLTHLPEDEQEAIKVLSVVQIFNEEIFDYLIKELNLPVAVTKFEDICQRTLIRNVEHDYHFYKTHDIISENISRLIGKKTVQYILNSYIKIIRSRVIYHYTSIEASMLLKHILLLIIFNELSVDETTIEKILDIYFFIKESLLPFNCDDIKDFHNYEPLKYLYNFIKALSEERQNSIVRLKYLNTIPEQTAMFGKHIKSLKIMKGYLRALCEGTQWLKAAVDEINPLLSNKESQEWYYGQTKIFFGDCYISYGMFKTGIKELETYARLIPELACKENDSFQVARHLAHGYRFNMFLEEAEILYASIIEGENTNHTLLQEVYILTNLCETCCFFKPEKVLSIKEKAFELANKFDDLKSKGKISYSLAIVYIYKRQYTVARQYIEDSINFNREDGYIAGQLYAYMARAYYEYSYYGNVSVETESIIRNIQKKIHVYGYFSVPLAMMQGHYSELLRLRTEYEWLNFDKTLLAYRKFLDLIR